jgi:phosphoribosylamine--glycine ligase
MAQQPLTILIIGGGGREHALAWRLERDDPSAQILAAPGNPGIADIARCAPIPVSDHDALLAYAREQGVSFTVVGPEIPLGAGIVDRFRAEGLPIFGPTRAAAEIETSKAFSKTLMRDAGVPTAEAIVCTTPEEARRAVDRFGAPVVIKASGLAAGKGVLICQDRAEAERAIGTVMTAHAFGAAGDTVVVEEFMTGEELSLFVVTDGERAIPLPPAQDHKRLLDGDRGPNTGGMGAYAPVSLAGDDPASSPLVDDAMDRIVLPTLAALRKAGRPFTGVLFTGLMLTPDGPKVVEFNCRFGDPEAQALLPVLDATPSLLELMHTVARGERLPGGVSMRASRAAVTTVVAAQGYPDAPRSADRVILPPPPDNTLVFHAGTARDVDGHLVTAGGRVLAITGVGATIGEAAEASRAYAGAVDLDGKQLRTDIAWRELARPR